ncbi:hypothetical protein [Nocardia sp. CA-145437]|uniref:hypothetical protein n=1 Tax=Nocardia sp. CA-145437 TaxID=3239980 RepID=UPI003D98E2AC
MTEDVIGFLRRKVSGAQQRQHEAEMHDAAGQLGYEIGLMVFAAPDEGTVVQRLMTRVWNEEVNAIIAPSADHFEPGEIDALVKFADVICVDTGIRYTISTEDGDETDDPTTVVISEGAR